MGQIKEGFTSSLILDEHPMRYEKAQIKEQYYITLDYCVNQFEISELQSYRLRQYQQLLLGKDGNKVFYDTYYRQCQQLLLEKKISLQIDDVESVVKVIISRRFQRWRKKYRYFLLCDIGLILLKKEKVQKAVTLFSTFWSKRQQDQFNKFASLLNYNAVDRTHVASTKRLVEQYHKNMKFIETPEIRILVTANMSAGKSTLINALIGKSIARTSQEVCTGNICYIYNKPYEDTCIHLETTEMNMNASTTELSNFDWAVSAKIASYFRTLQSSKSRICIIDTPGVNSALNRNHGRIAKRAMQEEKYDKLIYVFNANKLGTEDEMRHLKWVSNNIPKDKIIFVINKLDDFKCGDDDIHASIKEIFNDLRNAGFDKPRVFPISAYMGKLVKAKECGDCLTEAEEDEYFYLKNKFRKPEYDLSKCMIGNPCEEAENELLTMSKKCGLFNLEREIYGGMQ